MAGTATAAGAAIYTGIMAASTIFGSSFKHNEAGSLGTLYVEYAQLLSISGHTSFTGNTALVTTALLEGKASLGERTCGLTRGRGCREAQG